MYIGQCYTNNQACYPFRYGRYYADELIVANDYIYYFAGDNLVLYKKSGGGNTLSASVPCDDRHRALGNNTDKWFPGCDDYNHLRYRGAMCLHIVPSSKPNEISSIDFLD